MPWSKSDTGCGLSGEQEGMGRGAKGGSCLPAGEWVSFHTTNETNSQRRDKLRSRHLLCNLKPSTVQATLKHIKLMLHITRLLFSFWCGAYLVVKSQFNDNGQVWDFNNEPHFDHREVTRQRQAGFDNYILSYLLPSSRTKDCISSSSSSSSSSLSSSTS